MAASGEGAHSCHLPQQGGRHLLGAIWGAWCLAQEDKGSPVSPKKLLCVPRIISSQRVSADSQVEKETPGPSDRRKITVLSLLPVPMHWRSCPEMEGTVGDSYGTKSQRSLLVSVRKKAKQQDLNWIWDRSIKPGWILVTQGDQKATAGADNPRVWLKEVPDRLVIFFLPFFF